MFTRRSFLEFLPVVWLALLALPGAANAQLIYAVTNDNHLESFEASRPQDMLSRVAITGMLPNSRVLAIDFRARDRQLYAIGAVNNGGGWEGRLYRLNVHSARATMISANAFAGLGNAEIGFDIHPGTDEARIVTPTRNNFRIRMDTGQPIDGDPATNGVQPDTLLSANGIVAMAFDLNFNGAALAPLYGLDQNSDSLVRIGGPTGNPSPNLGAVTPIGGVGIGVPGTVGLDAGMPAGDRLYASFLTADGFDTFLVRINPATGEGVNAGFFARPGGVDTIVRDIAVLSYPQIVLAVTENNHLIRFFSHQPLTINSDVALTGLRAGERILAIDQTPHGRIRAISNQGRVLTILTTGEVEPFGGDVQLTSANVGFAWDQAADVGRLVDDTGRNLTVGSPAPIARTTLSRQGIAAISYAATLPNHTPALYGIDHLTDTLVRIGGREGTPSPNDGEVTAIGPLGVDVDATVGFDVDNGSNMGVMTLHLDRPAPNNDLDLVYAVDLGTGRATLFGTIGFPASPIVALTVQTAGAVQVSAPFTVNETAGTATVRFTRVAGSDPFALEYGTADRNALAGSDYTAVSGTSIFLEGENDKTIQIPITNDAVTEFAHERFSVFVANATAGVILTPLEQDIYILDDEAPPNAPPTITILQPTTTGAFEARSPFITISGTAADDRGVVRVGWEDSLGGEGVAEGTTQWVIPNYPVNGPGPITLRIIAVDELKTTTTTTLTITRPAVPVFTSLLAEGATGTFFDLDILLANPEGLEVETELTFLKENGSQVTHTMALPPRSRTTLKVDEIPGMEDASAATVVNSTHPIIVERTMRWREGAGYGAHTEKAVDGMATTWYFAEGSQGFFFTFLLLANPNATANSATVQYLRQNAPPITRTYPLAPFSRFTMDAGSDPDLVDQSFGMVVTFDQPAVAERAMYFGTNPLWVAGHESAGVTAPAKSWFLAEGATGNFFETFILLANPQAEDADVTVRYLLQGGTPVTKTHRVPAAGRHTINIEQEDPAVAGGAVATQVESSVPIIVERAQYWPFAPSQWYEAHNSFGVTATDQHWALAEGRVGGAAGYQTFILLANPGTENATVEIQFLRTSGQPLVKTFVVPAASRLNVEAGGELVPELRNEEFGAVISSTLPIAVERAMYASPGGLTWSAGTNATATRFKPIE